MSNVFSSQRYVPASLLRTCSIVRVPFSELSRGSDAGIATLSLNHINLSMGEILLSSLGVHLKKSLSPLRTEKVLE